MSEKLILVTNDDGIFAPGIKNLVSVAKKFGRVVVVAPDSPQSGQGHAITLTGILRLKKVDFMDDIEAYECSGTPVDCVKLAKNVVFKGQKIDYCFSGINHGANNSINIIYSGTMSAAMEAALEGIPSIGFSLCDHSIEADFSAAIHYVEEIIVKVLENNPGSMLLNVNIPKLPVSALRGFKVCRQTKGRWIEEFEEKLDPRGDKYYWMTGRFENLDQGEDHDVFALSNGYVSIVPVSHDLTRHEALEDFRYLEKTP